MWVPIDPPHPAIAEGLAILQRRHPTVRRIDLLADNGDLGFNASHGPYKVRMWPRDSNERRSPPQPRTVKVPDAATEYYDSDLGEKEVYHEWAERTGDYIATL